MKYLALMLLLSSCATFGRYPGVYSETFKFRPYTDAYLIYKGQYLGTEEPYYSIQIEFGDTEDPAVGNCYRTSSKYMTREITVNPGFWARANDEARLELVFHEMGHCDLNYEHQEEVAGIMNARSVIGDHVTDEEIRAFFLEGK